MFAGAGGGLSWGYRVAEVRFPPRAPAGEIGGLVVAFTYMLGSKN